jgi:phosphatidylserine decarboxylase
LQFLPSADGWFRNIMEEYYTFLASPKSVSVLNEDNWFSQETLEAMGEPVYVEPGKTFKFEDYYECDISAPNYGFKSWDDFFTRKFKGLRKVDPNNSDSAIVNPCEMQYPFNVRRLDLSSELTIKG